MKKTILAAVASVTLIAGITPASAQGWRHSWGPGWGSINERQAALDERIDRGVRSGCLSRREAYRLRGEFRQIAFLERRYRMSPPGLTRWERDDLNARLDRLARQIRYECRDGNGRGGHGGYRGDGPRGDRW